MKDNFTIYDVYFSNSLTTEIYGFSYTKMLPFKLIIRNTLTKQDFSQTLEKFWFNDCGSYYIIEIKYNEIYNRLWEIEKNELFSYINLSIPPVLFQFIKGILNG